MSKETSDEYIETEEIDGYLEEDDLERRKNNKNLIYIHPPLNWQQLKCSD